MEVYVWKEHQEFFTAIYEICFLSELMLCKQLRYRIPTVHSLDWTPLKSCPNRQFCLTALQNSKSPIAINSTFEQAKPLPAPLPSARYKPAKPYLSPP